MHITWFASNTYFSLVFIVLLKSFRIGHGFVVKKMACVICLNILRVLKSGDEFVHVFMYLAHVIDAFEVVY